VHRKIELQSPEDLAYLIANVRRAATERLHEAFPPVEGTVGTDELRLKIEQLVDEVGFQSPFFLFNLCSRCSRQPILVLRKPLTRVILVVHQQNLHYRRPQSEHQRAPRRSSHIFTRQVVV
jgi:hypothetical protein